MDETQSLMAAFALSAGIGLLVGLERERNPLAKAGVRTFTLIAVLGSLAALVQVETGADWGLVAGALAITAVLIAAYLHDPATIEDDSGTTTIIAALVVYLLGAANLFGYPALAVALGVGMTVLLYYKAELEGFSKNLTGRDIRSMLQFAVLSAVILPILPNRAFGPYGVLNPFEIWLIVVLVEAISLAGYLAWRLTLGRQGLVLTGLLGGAVSSTATTLAYARQVRERSQTPAAAILVILLANATMLVRVLVLVVAVAPMALPRALIVIVPGLLLAATGIALHWSAAKRQADGKTDFRNPTQLKTALAFGAIYAVILVLVAWANDWLGTRGVLAVSAVAGLTDVDAITLSSLRLMNDGTVEQRVALTAIALAAGANFVFKAGIAAVVGGPALRRPTFTGFALTLAGLAAGIWGLHALA